MQFIYSILLLWVLLSPQPEAEAAKFKLISNQQQPATVGYTRAAGGLPTLYPGASANSGQCPNNLGGSAGSGSTSTTVSQSRASSSSERIIVDELSELRRFEAKIVGIFSCLDGDFGSNDLTLDFRIAKPVIDLAVRHVNEKYARQIHFNVTYRTAPDICKHQQAAGHAADEYYVNGANYFVGPGCSESLASIGQLASYWNVPMCSTGYLPEFVTKRFNPLTLIQLSLSVESVGEMLMELFQMYKWRHLVILTDDSHPLHTAVRDGLLEFFHTMYVLGANSETSTVATHAAEAAAAPAVAAAPLPVPVDMEPSNNAAEPQTGPAKEAAAGGRRKLAPEVGGGGPTGGAQPQNAKQHPYYINITSRNFAYTNYKPLDYEQVMLEAASYSRVMLLLARSKTIDRLLVAAHKQGMSKGQFVFIAHELFETRTFQAPAGQQPQAQPDGSTSGGAADAAASTPAPQVQPPEVKFTLDDKIDVRSLYRHGADNATSNRDQLIREIFQPLMTISLRIPATSELDHFRREVARSSEREFNYQMQSLKSIYSLGLAAFIYDCVMLYADKINFILNHTQFSRIDGKTIFQLSAGKTFKGALSGDLTINRAGQRVIDFTLNDFSPKNLSLEPIAYFKANESKLLFLAGKQPHWASRNQSAPRSEPRCRYNDTFCNYKDEVDLLESELFQTTNYNSHLANSDRVVLGVWLLVIIVVSVSLTSSIIGYLVYRRFRIESELLNLWWSIKYEDIVFEDEADATCDGKRSMSSLAISNESFNESRQHQTGVVGASGRASGHQQQAHGASAAAGAAGANSPQRSVATTVMTEPPAPTGSGSAHQPAMQLSVSHSLSGPEAHPILSNAQSTSTLSVTGASVTGSQGVLATGEGRAGGHSASTCRLDNAGGGHRREAGSSSGHGRQTTGGKLMPLLAGKAAKQAAGSSAQLAGGKGRAAGMQPGAANKKDPSISSQNKNIKLRLGTVLKGGRNGQFTTKVGMYKASRVAAKHLNVRNLNINRQLLIELRQVRDLTHENLIKFIGLCPEEPNVAIVSELCTRGNLQDLLQNDSIRLDWSFRYSIVNDIVDGLIHLHSSPIAYHGRLKSSNCVIDNRFVVKLTDFGLPTLLAAVEMDEEQVNPLMLLWTAPEHLRTKHPLLSGSQKGDIYSLAIIFQEIITRCGPFECEPILCGTSAELGAPLNMLDWHPQQPAPSIRTTDGGYQLQQQQQQHQYRYQNQRGARRQPEQFIQPVVVQHKQRLEPEEIVNLVRMGLSPPFRPYFRPDVATTASSTGYGLNQASAPSAAVAAAAAATGGDFNVADLISVVQSCWQEAPAARPTITSVKQQIKKMRRGCHLDGANLMDNLLQRMERYTDNLESLVEQKTAELTEEKKRSEELLYEMLPRFVVEQLKYGHSVTPEAYEAVTISFSDIKDFTSIAAQSSPIEVVNLLNQLYTEFDDCIDRYDVYKVETIGDAYMVVSGLPVRNGDQHAREIAEMSLGLLDLIRNFHVVHLPEVNLELRIGIHSGPCASGVVGTRMFRYCLFGDTVNTASRMESHGEPMKIHTSEDTANILAKFGTFTLEPRGEIEIKGKGLMNTFWLTGRLDEPASPDY